MRRSRSRIAALAFLALFMASQVPAQLLGGHDSASAQGILDGLLPTGVGWQDWQATHDLYAHVSATANTDNNACPGNPQTQEPPRAAGDRTCQLPMNTTKPSATLPKRVARNTASPSALPAGAPTQVDVPDTERVWMRLEPPLKYPMKVTGFSATVFISFPSLTTCLGVTDRTGKLTVRFEVRALPSGDQGETSDGQTIGVKQFTSCPVDENPQGTVVFPLSADIPVQAGDAFCPDFQVTATLCNDQKLQFNVIVARDVAGEWLMQYEALAALTRLSVRSPDAFQFAAWTEARDRGVSNIFPIPVGPGDRFSTVGFFAFKTAFGGYDNPVVKSTTPKPTDAKWTMRVIGPNGSPVMLRDASVNPNPGEFEDCEDNDDDFRTCLKETVASTDTPPSARVFRMPDRPLLPGSSHVWNYTRARLADIAPCPNQPDVPCGGEFKLEITGRVRDNPIESRIPDGVRFTVGGFGVRLGKLVAGVVEESFQHQVRPGQSTTYLLNISNIAPKTDNFTLTSEVLSCSPSTPPCSAWSVAFAGRDVRGANVAFLQPQNASLLKVTVTPPDGGASATIRITARSQSAPDQFAQVQLTTQVSSTLTRGTSVFLFPDSAEKAIRRGETVTFNYTIWNRGTDRDSFDVNCDQGPDLTLRPSGLRNDDSWNGSISLGSQVIGCRDVNLTRALTTTLPPGDVAEAQVVLEASFNSTSKPTMSVQVRAVSQGDGSKDARALAQARVDLLSSFRLFILTDGTADPEDPQSPVSASRTLRFGKDAPRVCPDHANTQQGSACNPPPDEGPPGFNGDISPPVATQRLDINFTEYAFYRVTVVNNGDKSANFQVKIGEVRNATLDNTCNGKDSFTLSRRTAQGVGMNDSEGVVLLRKPMYNPPSELDRISQLPVPAGKSGVFYLRVHHEWNRHNLSILGLEPGQPGISGEAEVCDSLSTVKVQVTSDEPPFPRQTVTAETLALNRPTNDPAFGKSIVITQGARHSESNIYEADFRQSCPPVTPADSADKVFCKYVKPGNSVSWLFTASKFWALGDDFVVKPLRRVGGLSITDLVNRGWSFSPVRMLSEDLGKSVAPWPLNATGDEVTMQVDVTVPANATISDFAGLELEVAGRLSGASQKFSFFTIGAQKFKVNVTNLAGSAPVVVHPGDRAVFNLNISNEGAAVDVYNITIRSTLPQGYSSSFQPNETRVSPSRNKTVTVFIHTPPVGQFPQTVNCGGTCLVRVQSVVNLTENRGETFAEVPFTLQVAQLIPDNVGLSVVGTETRPISPGGSLSFNLDVSNPAPNEKKFVLRRLPASAEPLVDGWLDIVGESCFDVPSKSTKQVSFTVGAAADALDGTHVTYVLRVDEANSQCQPVGQTPNFAQALVTATVIGQVGLEVQPLDPVRVVPRGGSVSLPVRVRNVGTAGDTFFFQTNFVNQSQALPPDPWSADVRSVQGAPLQSLFVEAQTSHIVFVNVTAPLNVPFTGVRSDVDLVVRGTQVQPGSVRLTAFIQDYDIRVRLANATVDAFPGQTQFFVLNMTNNGNGIDTMDILVDIGGLTGFWNVTTEFSAVTLLNGTSKDIQISVQVPKSPLPTTGAVIGVNVRSRQVESIRPAAEALGLGSPLVALLNTVPKSSLISVNLFPYVSLDVDGDKEPELAIDRNRNPRDGFEVFSDPFTAIIQAVDLLPADGDGDGRIDHFIDINLDGRPDRYWDPDEGRLTAIAGSTTRGQLPYPDLNNDGTLEYLYDSDGDLQIDRWIDPATRRVGEVIEKDFDDDGNPEYLIDTDGDGRPDRYFDPDRGPRGLVTIVEAAPGGNPQQYGIDTNGGGRPNRVYDRVTGEVSSATFGGVVDFVANFWYLVLLFVAVAVLAGYLVVQRRRSAPPRNGGRV